MIKTYYSNNVIEFVQEQNTSILGKLNSAYNLENLNIKQTHAWEEQIKILKENLKDLKKGKIYFEFSIPRMGKRADNILVIDGLIFILEFKVGSATYDNSSINQVMDYALDLKNFHDGSHKMTIVPILISTKANNISNEINIQKDIYDPIRCNENNLSEVILKILNSSNKTPIDTLLWENSNYKPTPTIIEAAQALYRNHNVEDITRYEAGDNLAITTNVLNDIIESSKNNNSKSICFVTGVPGAGKTLVGLNIVNERKKMSEDENAVYLSGNGPLVTVLREALAQDRKHTSKLNGSKIKIEDARRDFNSKIQNIHHFRDEYFSSDKAPNEKVVIFDESQRAWNADKTSKFVKEKYRIPDFSKSEPEFLIDFMNRHEGWCSIICLVGGGQEINTGEGGIEEWIISLKEKFSNWNVFYSNPIIDTENYIEKESTIQWIKENGKGTENLHLSVPVRSFRSNKLSDFVESILSLDIDKAKQLYPLLNKDYPFVITRNKSLGKEWINSMKRGSERTGIVISSSAKRLRAKGIDSENGIRSNSDKSKIINWFLADNEDIRSSSFLEIPATQFAIQGLELDWLLLAWGGDLSYNGSKWNFKSFNGYNWRQIKEENIVKREFLINTYRVLLTRARQGLVIYIPHGDLTDQTRVPDFYDETYELLKSIGVKEIK